MPYFDFHIHPGLKPQFSNPASKPSPWERISIQFQNPNLLTRILKCGGINEVIDSQANLSQLRDAEVQIIGLAIHPPEAGFMRDRIITVIAQQEQTKFIDAGRIRDLASGELYYETMVTELEWLIKNAKNGPTELVIMKTKKDYNENKPGNIYAFITLEGAHSFMGMQYNNDEDKKMEDFWKNFNAFTAKYRIFSMTLSHLQDNKFANHAFGIQIFKQDPFVPTGNGITVHGFKLIQQLQEKKIHLDVKHLSLFARDQVYKFRQGASYLPLICTHAGLTGMSWTMRKKFCRNKSTINVNGKGGFIAFEHFKPVGYIAGTCFNPASINLYNEDIVNILSSKGIIGLSLDQRIIGVPENMMIDDNYIDDIFEFEIISKEEATFFLNVPDRSLEEEELYSHYDITIDDKQNFPAWHAKFFLNQVMHILRVANFSKMDMRDVINRICIGSDFDGLINPVDCCKNVGDFSSFKNRIVKLLKDHDSEFEEVSDFKISSIISHKTLIDKIFYDNGKRFIMDNF